MYVCIWGGSELWREGATVQEWREGETVEFELELVDFDKQPNWYHLDASGKIAQAELLKTQGNEVLLRP